MQVLSRNGIHLPALDLWLDPHHVRPSAFVSHAHADHMRAHPRVVTTPSTAAMMRQRGARRTKFQEVEFGQAVPWNRGQVTLVPAGHVLGSAQMLVEFEGVRLLYSGDFKLKPGLAAEAAEVPRADIVVMETTFGRPRYRFPPAEDVLGQIRDWCRATLDEGACPVLLTYSLGKGQEVLAGLRGLDAPIYLQNEHWQIAKIYEAWGVRFPDYELFDHKEQLHGSLPGVLLCSSMCRNTGWFSRLARTRTAYISGWAQDGGPRRFKTDAAFTLSDHADYDDLISYVERTGASTVFTLHGFEEEFAADLRERGLEARPLKEAEVPREYPKQMALFEG